jgi:hypothetical protein
VSEYYQLLIAFTLTSALLSFGLVGLLFQVFRLTDVIRDLVFDLEEAEDELDRRNAEIAALVKEARL